MGQFVVSVDAVGGHGCDRESKDGQEVYGCRSMNCPDCLTAEYVAKLARSGAAIKSATFTHWPGQPSEVVDTFETTGVSNIAKRTRKGSF